jgi:hypothetical protein
MIRYLTVPLGICLLIAVAFGAISAREAKSAEDLSVYLPHMDGLVPDGLPQKADDLEGLFRRMNGGAEQYIRYGFKRALFQAYKMGGSRSLELEIFQMKNEEAAHQIYILMAGRGNRKLDMGDEAVLGEYYLIFRKRGFYVTITGSDSKMKTGDELIAVARAGEEKMTVNEK